MRTDDSRAQARLRAYRDGGDACCVVVIEVPRGRRPRAGGFAVGAVLLMLSACAGTGTQEGSAAKSAVAAPRSNSLYKVGKPYQIKGVWYYPQIDYDYVEEGVASWYGPGFHGKATANGETYDQNDLTAAHRTLPLPSVVRVTNLDNGRSIKVRINDRGPFAQNRIIDMSRRGAQLLGFYGPGTAHVRVEIDAEESRQLAIALTGTDYPNGSMVASRQPSQPIDSDSTPVAVVGASSLAPATEATLVAAAAIEDTPAAMAPAPVPLDVGQTSLAYQPQPQWSPAATDYAAAGELAMADTPPVESVALASAAGWASPLPMEPHPAAMPARAPAEPAYPRPVRPLPAPTAASQHAYVQAGAFASADNAQRVRDRLVRLGPVAVVNRSAAGSPLYRVRLGPLPSVGEAERMLPTVIQAGFPGSQVVVE